MKVGGKNVFFLPHVSSKIRGADVQFGSFWNAVFVLEITPISFKKNQFFLNMMQLFTG